MNFDQIYPQATLGFEDEFGFIKGRYVLGCIACSQSTSWFHRGRRLYFCSPACFQNYQFNHADPTGQIRPSDQDPDSPEY